MNCQKHLFSLDPEVTYLNCAYMSPLMKSVEQAGIEGIQKKQKPNRITPPDFFTESNTLRAEYAKLIHANDPNRIVIIPSVSYGIANVAHNLHLTPQDEILVIGEQFPSNVYSWRTKANESGAKIITVPAPEVENGRANLWNAHILEAINSNTKLIACPHIHWADGTIFDLIAIRKKSSEVDALLVIDGTQSIGAIPFDVQEIKPDALIAASYKSLMGPYSMGLAYYGPAFDNGTPIEESWMNRYESEDFSNLVNYNDHYQPSALRYEVGEHSNFILVPMAIEAIRMLNSWGVENIKQYCDTLVEEPVQKLREAGFIIEDDDKRASNLFGIRLGPQHNIDEIKSKLQAANIFLSYRGSAVRIAPNVYNDHEDLEKFVQVLTT